MRQQPIRRPTQARNAGFDCRREPIVIVLISGVNDHADYEPQLWKHAVAMLGGEVGSRDESCRQQ
jgi:hypothetical protein